MFFDRNRFAATGVAASLALTALLAACGGGKPAASTATPAATASAPAPTATAAPKAMESAYLFGKEKVAVVDPKSGKVIKEITKGLEGAGAWNDAVVSADGRYVFVNENAKAQVYVFDTEKQELTKRLDVGSKPVHIYLPNHGTEVWAHADGDGTFYIIDAKSLEVTARAVASTSTPPTGHGKLTYDAFLGTKYYATNTTEPSIFAIDGKARTAKRIEVCRNPDGKGGTHGKAVSSVSKMAYFQCSGGEMGQRTVVVNTATDAVVTYLPTNGQIFPSPDGKFMTVANGPANRLDVIDASKDHAITQVPVPNRPDKVYYATVEGRLLAVFADLKTPDVDIVDMASLKIVKSVPGTPLAAPLAADKTLGRNSDLGGGYFFTVVKEQEQMSIVDLKTQAVTGTVKLPGLVNVVYVGAAR